MTARIPIIPPSSRGVSTNKRRVQCRRRLGRQTSSRRDHALSKGGCEPTNAFTQSPPSAIITSVASRRVWTTWESMLPVPVVVGWWIRSVTRRHIRAVIAAVFPSSVVRGCLYPIGLRWWCLTSISRRGRRVSKRLNTVRVKSKVIEVWNLLTVSTLKTNIQLKGTDLIKLLDQLWMFVCNMFLDECRSFEKLLTSLTPKFTFVFLLEIWLNSFAQLPNNRTI